MKKCEIEAVLPLPEEINGQKLPQSFYQQLVSNVHEIKEKLTKKVGRGYRESYNFLGTCKCAIRGKLIYISGDVFYVPKDVKYLRLAVTSEDIFFFFAEESSAVSQPNFTVKEV